MFFVWLGIGVDAVGSCWTIPNFLLCLYVTLHFCNPSSFTTQPLRCLEIFLVYTLAAPKPSSVRTTELNIGIPNIALCPLTLNRIQPMNFRFNTTQSSMVCAHFLSIKGQLLKARIALPCDQDGRFLPEYTRPPPPDAPDATEENPFHPFEDRLAFDWAHYHFVELQSSEREINKGLDLWLAAKLKAGDDTPLPWSSTDDMYRTIDLIQEGDTPFVTICFKYSGPIPPNPPNWMTEMYKLCTRDLQILLHHQLATTDFANAFTPRPYRQFDHTGDRVWSNLMSGDWAWKEAVHF